MVDKVYLFEHKLDHIGELIKESKGEGMVFIDDRAEILLRIKEQCQKACAIEVC